MNKRYQLIKPFLSDKIYETQTLNKAAKQCYKEVKLSNVKAEEFAIRDIDSAEVFRFKIHNPVVQSGGDIQIGFGTDEELKELKDVQNVESGESGDKLTDLEKRVEKLEQYLGLSIQQSLLPLTNEPALPPIASKNIYQANIDSLNAYRMIKNMDSQQYDNSNCVIL